MGDAGGLTVGGSLLRRNQKCMNFGNPAPHLVVVSETWQPGAALDDGVSDVVIVHLLFSPQHRSIFVLLIW